jgi:hypothetical protein
MEQNITYEKSFPDFHPAALADIEAKITYMRANLVPNETIKQFLTGLEDIVAKIQSNPTTWSFAKGSKLTRKVQLLRFRMTAFYQIKSDGVPVILELCGPGQLPRWKSRSPNPN